MLVVFSHTFVVNTKIISRHNFVAPLIEFFLFYHSKYRNPFEISEEDMAAVAPSFNVIEEDEDDDIELDIM